LAENEKWAKQLSANCGVDDKILKSTLEELSESCYADAPTAKKVIEELTLSCHINAEELRRFVKEVAKNCPIDLKKLYEEIVKAEGEKNTAFEAIHSPQIRRLT
jgi:polyhydroxyalkanoate synthesis regulator phasin